MVRSASEVPVRLEPWADLPEFEALLHLTNTPEMTDHLGGPESAEAIAARHRRYTALVDDATGRMFRIVLLPQDEVVGSIGYWEREWQGEQVYETGWGVLPAFQGRGIAAAAARALADRVRTHGRHRSLHAYPSVDHPASNAICRKAGFTLRDSCTFEYPPGSFMRCNDWRLELGTGADGTP
ncbi:GNAT family N-acetyltransferase [Kitasatospora nipponensis]|uniref:GNAT family N-acetyltransferase n=1 Tax=Kitasatospora nipponensis TaxID=258049 RepID=A0ABP4GCE3_9ACTN